MGSEGACAIGIFSPVMGLILAYRIRILLPVLLATGVASCGPSRLGDGFILEEHLSKVLVEDILEDPAGLPSELFAQDRPIPMILAADFSKLEDDRNQDSERRPGVIVMKGESGEIVEVPLEVNTRGRFRLQRTICPDPPLRLRFEDSLRIGTVFDGQGGFKLVTHCRDNETYHQNLLEEYLAYRFYNLLTDLSFRVQLVEITYVDTSGEREPRTRMGFVIEDEDALARRVGGQLVEFESTLPNQFVVDHLSLMYLFHYMIGNVDWGTTASHNIKLFQIEDGLYPVPYDFDWSGFVDAPYAVPNRLTEPHHDSVRERLYWGVCMPEINYQGTLALFRGVKEEIIAMVGTVPGLSEVNAQAALTYLEEFFAVVENPDTADREIVQACRPWL